MVLLAPEHLGEDGFGFVAVLGAVPVQQMHGAQFVFGITQFVPRRLVRKKHTCLGRSDHHDVRHRLEEEAEVRFALLLRFFSSFPFRDVPGHNHRSPVDTV